MLQELEVHEGRGEDVYEIFAQLVVTGLLVLHLAGEAAHRELAAPNRDGVDAGESAGEHQRQSALVDRH